MKVSYNWLKSLLPDLTASPEEVAEKLTLYSFETEITGSFAIDPNVLIARIVKLERHPQADRLQLATVDLGGSRVTVVCGATNIVEGDVVPYAPPGATLTDKEGNKMTVKQATIRGQESPGMLTSLRELGIGHEHSGLWLLPRDAELGEQITKQVPADTILETDLTPNRAHDSFSHVGLARELAALFNISVEEPSLSELPAGEPTDKKWQIDITDSRLARRYLGVVLDNLSSAPSPLWLQARLLAAGGKPINNLVDITNYVMFEYGNPMHLFDRQKLPTHTVTVRPASRGEQLITLDKEVRTLNSEDVVITSGKEPIALAGVIGGQAAQINDTTTQGLLEVGNFNAFSVQETARRLNVRTEASLRFSKDIDPNLVSIAAQRAGNLFAELAGTSVAAVIDEYPHPRQPKIVGFNPKRVSQIAGVGVTKDQTATALRRLRFRLAGQNKEEWQVTVPTDRLDVTEEHDLVEEVVRMVGLNEITPAKLSQVPAVQLPHHIYWREVVRDALTKLGMTEVYNASFEPARYAALLGLTTQPHLTIVNPPAPELSQLRLSLVPGLLANLAVNREIFHRNVQQGKESALFEIGNVYRQGSSSRVPGVVEEEKLAAVIVGTYPTLEDVAETLGEQLGIADLSISAYRHQTTEKLKYRVPLTIFELNLTELLQLAEGTIRQAKTLPEIESQSDDATRFTPYARYPAVFRDLSVIVGTDVSPDTVQEIIERVGGEVVTDVDLFDVYNSADDSAATDSLPRQSLAFHLTYQSPARTLTDEEVGALHNSIVEALRQELDATLRE